MMLCAWEDLPKELRTEAVRPYYEVLRKKRGSLILKRIFDVAVSALMLLVLLPLFIVLAAAIKADSPGPVFYRQVRVTQYGEKFRIFKFRTMVSDADKGSLLTVGADDRITRVGKAIRKYRLDEICQLIDVLRGTMTFVGTRPEVPKYVAAYTPEMMATLPVMAPPISSKIEKDRFSKKAIRIFRSFFMLTLLYKKVGLADYSISAAPVQYSRLRELMPQK